MENKKLAIIIDDEEFIRTLLDRIFVSLGYETRLYASALEMPCLNQKGQDHCQIESRIPEVLISDIQMPGLSGVELIKKIREQGCRIEKIGLMTGFSNVNLQEACETLECKAFHKPFTVNQIKEWIAE